MPEANRRNSTENGREKYGEDDEEAMPYSLVRMYGSNALLKVIKIEN